MSTRKSLYTFNPSISMRSRYNRSARASSFRSRKFNTIKTKMRKNNNRRKSRNSVYQMKKYKDNIGKLKEDIDRIAVGFFKMNNISKANLSASWRKGLINYRKGNYFYASQYFLMYLLVGTVLLDRHKAYRTAYKSSTTLSEPNVNELMCGLLDYSTKRNSNFNHKTKGKAISNKLIGPINYFKDLFKGEKIFKKDNEEAVEDVFDLVYNCRNPYIKKAINLV